MRQTLLVLLLAAQAKVFADDIELKRFSAGFTGGLNYTIATALATGTDLHLGFGVATGAEFSAFGEQFAASIALQRSARLTGNPANDGSNAVLCRENFFSAYFTLPGPCMQYQLRLHGIWLYQNWGIGLTYAYNYHTDFTYKGAQIFNTRWAFHSLGPAAGYHWNFGRFQLSAFLYLDIGIYSVTLSGQKVQAFQPGITIYGLYALF